MQPVGASDDELWRACRRLPSDWEPHGQRRWIGRAEARPDCATCRWFSELFHAWPEWGTCLNPESPRAGLLTNWAQGCWQHEPATCPRHRQAWRERCGFAASFERALREQAAEFARDEVRKANDPMPDEKASPTGPQGLRGIPLLTVIRQLLVHADEDFRRPALDRMVASARNDTRRSWEVARRYWARAVGADMSDIRLPSNTRQLENGFWRHVEAALSHALKGRRPGRSVKGRRRAGDKRARRADQRQP